MCALTIDALKWISELLNQRQIPFVICGGLAAIAYGSQRPLNDIDLFVPGEYFHAVVSAGSDFISKPAKNYCGEGWDLEYVQFMRHGTKIEVGNAADAKIYAIAEECWINLNIDFDNVQRLTVLGVELPIMSAVDLIGYKEKLDRPVDREDIVQIKRRA